MQHQKFTLDPTCLSHKKMQQQWFENHPQLAEMYQEFIQTWPSMAVTTAFLADFLSNNLKIYNYSLFELCLTNGIIGGSSWLKHDYINPIKFGEAITATAASALQGLFIKDSLDFEWSAYHNVDLSYWLQERSKGFENYSHHRFFLNHENSSVTVVMLKKILKAKMLIV